MSEEAEWESKFSHKKEANIWGPDKHKPEQREISTTRITTPPSIWENPSSEKTTTVKPKAKAKARAVPKPKTKIEEKPVINLFDDDEDDVNQPD